MMFVPSLMFVLLFVFFFFKQKTAYEMRISDWSSDVCSSDLSPHWHAVSLCSFAVCQKGSVSGLVVMRIWSPGSRRAGPYAMSVPPQDQAGNGKRSRPARREREFGARDLVDRGAAHLLDRFARSEERLVGKGGVSKGRSRGS